MSESNTQTEVETIEDIQKRVYQLAELVAEQNAKIDTLNEHLDTLIEATIDNEIVTIGDIKMPLDSMIVFMIKWGVATIPAFIVLGIIGAIGVIALPLLGIQIGR